MSIDYVTLALLCLKWKHPDINDLKLRVTTTVYLDKGQGVRGRGGCFGMDAGGVVEQHCTQDDVIKWKHFRVTGH